MSLDQNDKINMLERAVLELGTELYAMKGSMVKQKESHQRFLAILRGLKQLLDHKGLITTEDFDAAVELGEAVDRGNSHTDTASYLEFEKAKKSSH